MISDSDADDDYWRPFDRSRGAGWFEDPQL